MYAALADFGAPLEGLTASDFTLPDKFFRIGGAPLAIDIFPHIPGLEFDRAWQNRAEELIDAQTGLTAFYVSSEDLIAAKLASGRPQDIADVDALRQAARNKK